MRYTLVKTDKAMESMKNVLHFIARHFDADRALDKIDELEKAVNLLTDDPYIGIVPRDRVLKRQGYRVLITDMDVVFYKINEPKKEIVIYLVADQRQDYMQLLK